MQCYDSGLNFREEKVSELTRDVKVISDKECFPQHLLIVAEIIWKQKKIQKRRDAREVSRGD